MRRYFTQPVIEAAITPQSTEILLCQHGLPNGYRVIIRSADKTEREIDAGASLTLHSAEERQKISDGIAAVTGLPVRLVIRRRLADKTFSEKPGEPNVSRADLHMGSVLATGALPLAGGIAAGFAFTRPAFIVGVGLALWLVWRLALFAIKRDKPRWSFATATHTVSPSLSPLLCFALIEEPYSVGFYGHFPRSPVTGKPEAAVFCLQSLRLLGQVESPQLAISQR